MNFQPILADLRTVMTLQEIATASGLPSRGAVHNIATGAQKTVMYEAGVKLVALHKAKAKAIAQAKLKATE